ncbi:MAG: hypothetical protein FJX57_02640 [Alphaproteobacteria bacterium]|nr:hypothetical protein [Alphaproteobacteria bacterium]
MIRSRMAIAALCGLAAVMVAASATAQQRQSLWETMPCEDSVVAIKGHLACRVRRPIVQLSGGGEIPTEFQAAGEIADTRVRLQLSLTKAPQHFRAYPEQDAVRAIRAFATDAFGSRLTEWSGPSAQRALTFVTFRTEDRACFGFDIPGPPHPLGGSAHMHAWILRGVICPAEGQPVNRRALLRYLEAIRVSVQDPTRNAIGTELQPWP